MRQDASNWTGLFDRPAGTAEELGKAERHRLRQRWRECFIAHARARTGKWGGPDERDWMWLEEREARSLKGARAQQAFGRVPPGEFFALPSEPGLAVLRCSGERLPDAGTLADFVHRYRGALDIYLFAADLSWTFVVPHEADSGPFFSTGGTDSSP